MKYKLLAAVASVAFIATGVAAQAQDNTQKRDERPAAERPETKAPAAGMHAQGAPKAAQNERRDEANPAARPEGAKREGQEPNKAAQGEMQHKGQQPNRAAEENHNAPAAKTGENEHNNTQERTGANEQEHNAPAAKTGENEHNKTQERTGANEQDHNATRTGENERNKTQERTGANEQDHNATRTGENERGKMDERTAEHEPRIRGNVHISQEHVTKVTEVLRRDMRPERVDISVNVGMRVPEHVVIRPLPEEVVALAPEYRGYDYFIDSNDEIVFVSPESHEVVGMIDYEGRAATDQSTTQVSAARPCPTEQ